MAAAGAGRDAADPLLVRLRGEGLLLPGRPIVVMVSGGRDSTCLLHAAVALAGTVSVRALHVDYGLREAADGDRRHCEALCHGLGVGLHVHRPADPPQGNLQAWARGERYRAAEALAAPDDARVAAAHTADDQLETIVYRLLSSPSPRAITGMPARAGRLVRPLLGVTRAQVNEYLTRHDLGWREDASNHTAAYVRNRIRHELLPLARELHPGVEANLIALAARVREQQAVLEALVDDALGGEDVIELHRLARLAPALRRMVVQRLADQALGTPAAGVAARAEEIAALPRVGRAELHVGRGLRAVAEGGRLAIERLPPTPGRRVGADESAIHSGR